MKRLLFVVNHARWFLTHRVAIADAAARAGYEVHVATPESEYAAGITVRGHAWHSIPLTRSGRNPVGELRILTGLYRLYRSFRPDLVHHVSMKPVLYGTPAAKMAGVPAVVNAMTGLGHLFLSGSAVDRLSRAAVGLAFRLGVRHPHMRVLFQNEDDLDLLVGKGWVKSGQAKLVRSAVDPEAFSPPAAREDRGDPMVMLPARMLRTKGVPEFLEAARSLRSQGVRARFVLVGSPDPSNPASLTDEELEAVHRAGTAEYWGEREDMASVYRMADVVCLPSHREGMPKVLLEASACGLPLVTTDVPGCRHVVTDGLNGLLVPVGDVSQLAAALARLIEDAELRLRMGREARQRVEREFSMRHLADVTLELYSELLGETPA